jgi:hypothetical protein
MLQNIYYKIVWNWRLTTTGATKIATNAVKEQLLQLKRFNFVKEDLQMHEV